MEGPRGDDDEGAGAERFGRGTRTNQLRLAAMRCARDVAQGRGEPLAATFRDTLSGDVARLQVWRQLRRLFPDVTLAEAGPILDEVLAP
jgi:hypothetical protein